MRLLTELSLLSAPRSRERGRQIHKEAIENFKGVVWLIWALDNVRLSQQAVLVPKPLLINAFPILYALHCPCLCRFLSD